MTKTQYDLAAREAANYTDPDAFVSDLLTSSAFPPEDETAPLLLDEADTLRRIWIAAEAPFRAFLAAMGLTQTGCSQRFLIPLRTVQNWAGGINDCPRYLRLMMAQLTGYINA